MNSITYNHIVGFDPLEKIFTALASNKLVRRIVLTMFMLISKSYTHHDVGQWILEGESIGLLRTAPKLRLNTMYDGVRRSTMEWQNTRAGVRAPFKYP